MCAIDQVQNTHWFNKLNGFFTQGEGGHNVQEKMDGPVGCRGLDPRLINKVLLHGVSCVTYRNGLHLVKKVNPKKG